MVEGRQREAGVSEMMLPDEFNFVHPSLSGENVHLFGFENAQNCVSIEDGWTMAHVMHTAGIFPSVTSAKKQGWNKPIPAGFSEHTVGKRKVQVFILNNFEGSE